MGGGFVCFCSAFSGDVKRKTKGLLWRFSCPSTLSTNWDILSTEEEFFLRAHKWYLVEELLSCKEWFNVCRWLGAQRSGNLRDGKWVKRKHLCTCGKSAEVCAQNVPSHRPKYNSGALYRSESRRSCIFIENVFTIETWFDIWFLKKLKSCMRCGFKLKTLILNNLSCRRRIAVFTSCSSSHHCVLNSDSSGQTGLVSLWKPTGASYTLCFDFQSQFFCLHV